MFSITPKGILIEIPGLYDPEEIDIIREELIEALEIATSTKEREHDNFSRLFGLLKAICLSPNDPIQNCIVSEDRVAEIKNGSQIN